MEITILRLGHRLPRDERISTHVALVARAFGAGRAIYSGQHDEGLESSVTRLVAQWGGGFTISYEKNWRKALKEHKESGFIIIHLTMYGMPLPEKLAEIKNKNTSKKLLVVVGSEQVPGEVYALADFNVAVTGQPHSEVAALAVLLDRLMEGRELERESGAGRFPGARVRVEPDERGKRAVETAEAGAS